MEATDHQQGVRVDWSLRLINCGGLAVTGLTEIAGAA